MENIQVRLAVIFDNLIFAFVAVSLIWYVIKKFKADGINWKQLQAPKTYSRIVALVGIAVLLVIVVLFLSGIFVKFLNKGEVVPYASHPVQHLSLF